MSDNSYDYHIIANPDGKAWDFAYSVYEKIKQRDEKVSMNEFLVKTHRDTEIKAKIKNDINRKNCFFIHDSSEKPAEWLMQLLFINQAMKSSAHEIIDVLPYLKFSRQDRKDESRVAINARALARYISIYANRVLTIDVHSDQIAGFYDIAFDNLYSSRILLNYLKTNHLEILENLIIMSPDAGGANRAKGFATRFGVEEIVVGYKSRPRAGEIDDYKIAGDVSGKNVLMIDDIVDSGNTLVKASEEARKQGAKKVYAYCTHGVLSPGDLNEDVRERVSNKLDLMISSNSIFQPEYDRIAVMPLEDFFAEAIYLINNGITLETLFE